MTPTFINSSSSSFHGRSNGDHDQHQFLGPNYHQAASSSSYSCHFHFNPTQDQTGYYNNHSELYQPQQQLEGNKYAAYGGSYELSQENKASKLHGDQADKNPSKWMSSKMRLMQKMKNTDIKGVEITSNATIKREDQKQPSSSMEIDCSSNSSSNNSNVPIRVCADCNTTKTPLWRSGPKGPKSLCNACGIRQRKARRAMAAAAAAANDSTTQLPTETPTVKIKVHHKEKTKNNGLSSTVPFKKRCKVTAGSSQEPKKLGSFEDYLINLSKNLAFHHVFPQDEKEAAILLMALSCGLVHG